MKPKTVKCQWCEAERTNPLGLCMRCHRFPNLQVFDPDNKERMIRIYKEDKVLKKS